MLAVMISVVGAVSLSAQKVYQVSGVITDQTHQPLIGANVQLSPQ